METRASVVESVSILFRGVSSGRFGCQSPDCLLFLIISKPDTPQTPIVAFVLAPTRKLHSTRSLLNSISDSFVLARASDPSMLRHGHTGGIQGFASALFPRGVLAAALPGHHQSGNSSRLTTTSPQPIEHDEAETQGGLDA